MRLTAAQLIDIAGMKAIYAHLDNDPEIEKALQIFGDRKDLAEIGDWMMNGSVKDVENFSTACKSGKIKLYTGNEIPATNAIYCLYLPPFYVFVNLNRLYI